MSTRFPLGNVVIGILWYIGIGPLIGKTHLCPRFGILSLGLVVMATVERRRLGTGTVLRAAPSRITRCVMRTELSILTVYLEALDVWRIPPHMRSMALFFRRALSTLQR